MKRSKTVVLLSIALVLAGIWGTVMAGHDRPIRARLMTSFDPGGIGTIPPLGCFADGLAFEIEAGGLVTHLGRSTLTAVSEVFFPTGEQCGEAVVTAANGDELWFDFEGGSATDPTGQITFSGNWAITGGTGRFADAEGGGTYAGSANAASGQGEWFLEGAIDY